MNYKQFQMVYIDIEYLKALHSVDSEVFYSEESNYEAKPCLGVLINNNNFNYVIPLTSAKKKHLSAKWKDISDTYIRIYEIIDVRKVKINEYDIISDDINLEYLKNMKVKTDDFCFYKKRILSILEIKKMIPVIDSVITKIDLNSKDVNLDEVKKHNLLLKEYSFLKQYKKYILKRASKIYDAQTITGAVKPFHCNYKALEKITEQYSVE